MIYPGEFTIYNGGPAMYTPVWPSTCFMCDLPTDRVDVCFEAYFCGSPVCEWAVGVELDAMNRRAEARVRSEEIDALWVEMTSPGGVYYDPDL